jgi:site-specific recombinase XerD
MRHDMDQFLYSVRRSGASQKTLANYRLDLDAFSRWLEENRGEGLRAASITPDDVRAYEEYLLVVEGCKPTTVSRRLTVLQRLTSWAEESRKADDRSAE